MRKIVLAALGALALGTAGCGGCAVLDPSQGVLTQTAVDEKALYGLEAGFYGANAAAEAAVDSGALVAGSPVAVQIANALANAHAYVLTAEAAYRAGDARTYAAKAESASALVAQVWALIPGKKGV